MLLPRKSRDRIRTLHALCLRCDCVYNMSCVLCGLCDHVIDVRMMFITWIVMCCVYNLYSW